MSRPMGHGGELEVDLGDASNILLLASTMDSRTDEGCARLLTPDVEDADGDEGTAALSITLTESPDERLAAWRPHTGPDDHDELGFVSVGETTRSAAAQSPGDVGLPGLDMTVETVSSPADLTGMGIKISEIISEWAGDGRRIVVCFHTLTTLLQYVDVQDAFRFLHMLTGRLKSVGATAHYHMDPAAHEEREVNTLKAVFDAVVEFDDDGEWVVRTR